MEKRGKCLCGEKKAEDEAGWTGGSIWWEELNTAFFTLNVLVLLLYFPPAGLLCS